MNKYMPYELELKLKEAGFPQKKGVVVFRDTYVDHEGNLITNPDEYAYPPTLSELITECGDRFEYLNRVHGTPDSWFAGTQDDYAGTEKSIFQGEKGATPEEAVANLWLKLHTTTH